MEGYAVGTPLFLEPMPRLAEGFTEEPVVVSQIVVELYSRDRNMNDFREKDNDKARLILSLLT